MMEYSQQIIKAIRTLVTVVMIALLLPMVVTAGEEKNVYILEADGIACPFCAYGIEKQLNRINGVESTSTDIKTGTVAVTMRSGVVLDEAEAQQAVEDAGFTMRGFELGSDSQ